jgi:hypothetical protein
MVAKGCWRSGRRMRNALAITFLDSRLSLRMTEARIYGLPLFPQKAREGWGTELTGGALLSSVPLDWEFDGSCAKN